MYYNVKLGTIDLVTGIAIDHYQFDLIGTYVVVAMHRVHFCGSRTITKIPEEVFTTRANAPELCIIRRTTNGIGAYLGIHIGCHIESNGYGIGRITVTRIYQYQSYII